jgi:hypothetical protein
VDKATEIRARILDAAEGCLLDGGFRSGRLHSTIAARARISVALSTRTPVDRFAEFVIVAVDPQPQHVYGSC